MTQLIKIRPLNPIEYISPYENVSSSSSGILSYPSSIRYSSRFPLIRHPLKSSPSSIEYLSSNENVYWKDLLDEYIDHFHYSDQIHHLEKNCFICQRFQLIVKYQRKSSLHFSSSKSKTKVCQ